MCVLCSAVWDYCTVWIKSRTAHTFGGCHDGDGVVILLFLFVLLPVVLLSRPADGQVVRGLQRAAADGQLEQVLGETVVLHVGQKGLHTLWDTKNHTMASVSYPFMTKKFFLPIFSSISRPPP